MKYLLVLLVVGLALWWMAGRRRGGRPPSSASPPPPPPAMPERMVSCVHCGLHLPGADALRDGQGRPFCSDAHRLAGPR